MDNCGGAVRWPHTKGRAARHFLCHEVTIGELISATFRALTKEIEIGLSIQRVDDHVLEELLIQGGAVSPIVTIEPRRRKFHKAITVTMPLPERVAHYSGRPSTFAGGGGGGGGGGGDDSSTGASRKTSFDSGHKLYLGK